MKITSSSWDRSDGFDDFNDDISEDLVSVRAMTAGLAAMAFTSCLFGAMLFCVVHILRWQNIVDFGIGWGASILLGVIYVFLRSVSAAVFKDRD